MKAPWTDKDVSYLNPPTSEVRYVEDAIYLDISFNVTLLPWEKTVSPKSIEREMGFNKYTRSLRGFFEVKVLGTHTYRQDTSYGFVFYGVNMTIRMEKKKPGMGPNMTKTFLVDLCSRLASEVGVYRSAKIIQHFRSTPGRDLQIK